MMTMQDIRNRLREAIHTAGSQRAFAQAHRFSEQYVSDVLHGHRDPSQRILAAIGIEQVVTYRPIESVESKVSL